MQGAHETGSEFIDARLLSWEQRYALKRRAIAFAHAERARVRADAVRRSWSAIVSAARRVALAAAAAKPALGIASPRP
jgi:hypothetical protein